MLKNPCYKCKERKRPNEENPDIKPCHDYCERYIEFAAARRKVREAETREKRQESICATLHENAKRIWQHRKRI